VQIDSWLLHEQTAAASILPTYKIETFRQLNVMKTMSQIDIDLNLLKQRIAALEEQKRIEAEKEAEKKANPMKVLEGILDEKKKQIENNRYSKSLPLARFYDQEKVAMLEPILNMLVDIQRRLDALEKKE
jgi:hypothetical protein